MQHLLLVIKFTNKFIIYLLAIMQLILFNTYVLGKTISTTGNVKNRSNPLSLSSDRSYYNATFMNGDTVTVSSHYDFIIADIQDAIIGSIMVNTGYSNKLILQMKNDTILGDVLSGVNHAMNEEMIWLKPVTCILNGTNYEALSTLNFNDQYATLTFTTPLSNNLIFQNASLGTVNINDKIVMYNQSLQTVKTINIASELNYMGEDTNFTNNINYTSNQSALNINGNNNILSGTINGSAQGVDTFNIKGNVLFKDTIFNLGLNTLNYNGNATASGTMTLIVKYNNLLGGNIMITNGNLDLSKLDNLRIIPIVNLHDIPDKHYSCKLIKENGGTITPIAVDQIIIDGKERLNRYVNYNVDDDLILHFTNIAEEKLQNDLNIWVNEPNNQFIAQEVNAVNQLMGMNHNLPTNGVLFINNLGSSTQTRAKETLDKLIISIPPKNNYVNQHIGTVLATNNSKINSRMSPVSTGSEGWKKDSGMWVSPLYNRSKQKENSGVSGYKSKSQGIMFGADTVINDSYLVGLSYGQIFSKMTYRNLKAGDNTKSLINIFSLYGAYNNTGSAWFTEGLLSYTNSRINNHFNRLIYNGSVETALGKYKSRVYSGQLVKGYNFHYDNNIIFSPVVGLRYSCFRDESYSEQNTSFQNLSVRGISYNKFEGVLGLRGAVNKEYHNWLLTPSVHTYLDYTFKGKVPDAPVILDGLNGSIMTKHSKLSKTLLTIGGNLRVQRGKMEFGFTYDSFLAKKYYAYQISMKAKVHF